MRDSGFVSIGAELREVDLRPRQQVQRAAAAARRCRSPQRRRGADERLLHVALHVLLQDAAVRPLPFTFDRSTPSSRANLRTDGDACAALNACGRGAAAARSRRGPGCSLGGGEAEWVPALTAARRPRSRGEGCG